MASIGTIQIDGSANSSLPEVETADLALRETPRPRQLQSAVAAAISQNIVRSVTTAGPFTNSPILGFRWSNAAALCAVKSVVLGFGSASADTAGVWTANLFRVPYYQGQYTESKVVSDVFTDRIKQLWPSALRTQHIVPGLPPVGFSDTTDNTQGGTADIVVPAPSASQITGEWQLNVLSNVSQVPNFILDPFPLASISVGHPAAAGSDIGDKGLNGTSLAFPLWSTTQGDQPLMLQMNEGFVIQLTTPNLNASNQTGTMSISIIYDSIQLGAGEF